MAWMIAFYTQRNHLRTFVSSHFDKECIQAIRLKFTNDLNPASLINCAVSKNIWTWRVVGFNWKVKQGQIRAGTEGAQVSYLPCLTQG